MKFSVLMSVYHRESPDNLRQCLDSLVLQTLPANEVVIVEDGPLGERLDAIIADYGNRLPLVPLPLPAQVGLGSALRAGLSMCRGEYVARMDSDDICVPERFQNQVAFLDSNRHIDVVGSAIEEFDFDFRLPRSIRRLPVSGRALLRFAKGRNPLNHMTAMFRRASVLAAGSYQHFPGFEDYHLWARMLTHGQRLHNMQQVFVRARCGDGLQSRRGGFAYLKQDVAFQLFLRKMGFVATSGCLRNIVVRVPMRLAPRPLRSLFYRLFLRIGPPPSRENYYG
jgi:glycosyltransferase involved in cell wall biosynthesis